MTRFSIASRLLIVVVWICTILSCCHIATCRKSNERADLHNQANHLLDQSQFPQAINIYKSLVDSDSTDHFALQGLAIGYTRVGRMAEAAKIFYQAGEISHSVEFYLNAGMAFQQSGQNNDALQSYVRCVETNKQFRECHVKLASVYFNNENYVMAHKHLQSAIELNPKDPSAYSYLGDTLNNLKQFNLAIDAYKQAIKLQPSNIDMHIALADAYKNAKKDSNAVRIYAKLLKKRLQPRDKFRVLLGYVFSGLEIANWQNYEQNIYNLMNLSKDFNVHYPELLIASQGQIPPNPLTPFMLLYLPHDAKLALETSSQWATALVNKQKLQAKHTNTNKPKQSPSNPTNINIGYLSRRFHDYPGTQMMLRLFENHNRSYVNVNTIANGPDDGSEYRQYIQAHSDVHLDMLGNPMMEGLRLFDSMDLDVLIDYGMCICMYKYLHILNMN